MIEKSYEKLSDNNLNSSYTDLFRFITAGSVDDGKSTLIGRLLYDSKVIFMDQLKTLSNDNANPLSENNLDFSLITDGLEAEREQGITIDVAYRYFSTPKRKFIIADTPGHEQYTRNMVTGASTADAAIVLIDITKIKTDKTEKIELLEQTKRHCFLASLLNLKYLIIAVNKMDLVNFDKTLYQKITDSFTNFAENIEITNIYYIPISALNGDNVVNKSKFMNWYKGPSLINLLDSLPAKKRDPLNTFRFPVQMVCKYKSNEISGFRSYMGRVESGNISINDKVLVQPKGLIGTIKSLKKYNSNVKTAFNGQCITIQLEEELDISRGDFFVLNNKKPSITKDILAEICWLSEEPLILNRKYLLKHTTKTVFVKVIDIVYIINISNLLKEKNKIINLNSIAKVKIKTQHELVFDTYKLSRSMGSFILIDEYSHQTVAAGMIR